MNIGQTKHYSLLLQDDGDTSFYEGVGHHQHDEGVQDETVMDADFHTIIDEAIEEEDEEEEGEEEVMEEEKYKLSPEEMGVVVAGEESEEELFNGSKHRAISHEGLKLNGRHGSEYHLLSNGDTDSGASTKGSSGSLEHQPRLAAIWTPAPMSPARRACVLATVMLGVLVTVMFVWVMPCGVDDLCGVAKSAMGGFLDGEEGGKNNFKDTWMQVLTGIGSNDTLAIISSRQGAEDLLMSFYRPPNNTSADQLWDVLAAADCRDPDQEGESETSVPVRCGSAAGKGEAPPPLSCGLMLLNGDTGDTVWQTPIRECPVLTMCHLMDPSGGGGVSACLVVGAHSLVLLLDPHSGRVLWQTRQRNDSESTGEDVFPTLLHPGKPVLLPDVTDDSHPDLLFPGVVRLSNYEEVPNDKPNLSVKYHTEDQAGSPSPDDSVRFQKGDTNKDEIINKMVLISGSSGEIVGTPYKINQCRRITDIANDGESIDYSCVMSSGNKLAGKIPLVSLIHQIIGPQPSVDNKTSQGYPSIVPFIPTPDVITNRYCQVEVINKGLCPLCEAKVKLMSSSEVENLWQVEYDASVVVDWEPLVSEGKCYGLVLKVIAWDEIGDESSSTYVDSIPVTNQRTTRSSFGSHDNDDEEEEEEEEDTEAEEGFSAAGETLDLFPVKEKRQKGPPMQYWLQSDDPNRNRVSKFTDDSYNYKTRSKLYNPPVSHARHNRMRNMVNDHGLFKSFSGTAEKRISPKPQTKEDVFEHPTIHSHNGIQASIHEAENKKAPGMEEQYLPVKKESKVPVKEKKKFVEVKKVLPKISALYAKDLESEAESSEITSFDTVDYRHSTVDFELPINIFGLPIDTQPPDGFSLQRLTEYVMLVQFNGSSWTDIALKKAPIFQLCKEDACIPNERFSNKLVVSRVGGAPGSWSIANAVTTVTHGGPADHRHPGEDVLPLDAPKPFSPPRVDAPAEGSSRKPAAALHADADRSTWTVKTFVSKTLIAP